jgi:hypothetical protein
MFLARAEHVCFASYNVRQLSQRFVLARPFGCCTLQLSLTYGTQHTVQKFLVSATRETSVCACLVQCSSCHSNTAQCSMVSADQQQVGTGADIVCNIIDNPPEQAAAKQTGLAQKSSCSQQRVLSLGAFHNLRCDTAVTAAAHIGQVRHAASYKEGV